jgi:hypothetical protein
MSNFINDCIHGYALMSEIDDYIDGWHDSDSGLSLHEFLGMTEKEYALYVQDDVYLASIITAHRDNINIVPLMARELKMAARSDDAAKAKQLQQWLDREKLWE